MSSGYCWPGAGRFDTTPSNIPPNLWSQEKLDHGGARKRHDYPGGGWRYRLGSPAPLRRSTPGRGNDGDRRGGDRGRVNGATALLFMSGRSVTSTFEARSCTWRRTRPVSLGVVAGGLADERDRLAVARSGDEFSDRPNHRRRYLGAPPGSSEHGSRRGAAGSRPRGGRSIPRRIARA